MRSVASAMLLVLAACGGADGAIDNPCSVDISFSPSMPIAGPLSEVRATASIGTASGASTYTWTVVRGGALVPYDDARLDGSEIAFTADAPGVYNVTLDVDVPGYVCNAATRSVTARASDESGLVRLHVVPPLDVSVPPAELLIEIPDSPDFDLGNVALDPGTSLSGTVQGTSAGVPAYLRFMPVAAPDAVVEAFADASGAFSARLAKVPHDVLIVPGGGFAPALRTWSPISTGTFLVSDGFSVGGTVRNPAGAALAGAKVQLFVDGVPSTLATTAGDGSYAVKLDADGTTVKVEVAPPPATGLPRLEAFGAFDLGLPIDINYSSSLVVRDLSGMQLRRNSNPLANAKVTVVGALSTGGSIAGTNATGTVRVSATANASGTLPSTLVAAGPLVAVIAAAPTDLAVVTLDLTSSVPSSVTAPSMVSIGTTITDGTSGLDGALLQLVPRHSLALAGASSIYLTAGATGAVAAQIPSGGVYDVRITDPVGRAGALFASNVSSATLMTTYALPEAVFVTGELSIVGNPNRLVGASVQILCTVCDGVDRARPLAEGATDQGGGFTLAVPKPGAL